MRHSDSILWLAQGDGDPSRLEILGPVSGVVAAALIAALVKFKSDKRGREVEAQREALYRLQDVSLTYRLALIKNGDSVLSPKREREAAAVEGQLAAAKARCSGAELQNRITAWQKNAEYYWTGAAEYTRRDELEAWNLLQNSIGDELRKFDA